MSKKIRTGPRIRVTRPALHRRPEEYPTFENQNFIYSCQYCCVKFTQNSHFFRHMTSNHQVQQRQATFQCNECQIIFRRKSNLDLHCQTHHQTKSKSRCETCDITFKSRYCLRRHLKLKQILAENSCIKCQKKFTSKERLNKHYNSKHTYKNLTFESKVPDSNSVLETKKANSPIIINKFEMASSATLVDDPTSRFKFLENKLIVSVTMYKDLINYANNEYKKCLHNDLCKETRYAYSIDSTLINVLMLDTDPPRCNSDSWSAGATTFTSLLMTTSADGILTLPICKLRS
ncbi:unnamed protein product [Leptosia nina]|uniref:C2H2-type domain-containing protein n=1 Tax=Leptosia nina TaxID=320188 RepID=A0AAV1K1K8_9NEOP